MPHPHDFQERLVSGHPGSKQHMGGRSNAQRRRDRIVRARRALAARVAWAGRWHGLIVDEVITDEARKVR